MPKCFSLLYFFLCVCRRCEGKGRIGGRQQFQWFSGQHIKLLLKIFLYTHNRTKYCVADWTRAQHFICNHVVCVCFFFFSPFIIKCSVKWIHIECFVYRRIRGQRSWSFTENYFTISNWFDCFAPQLVTCITNATDKRFCVPRSVLSSQSRAEITVCFVYTFSWYANFSTYTFAAGRKCNFQKWENF